LRRPRAPLALTGPIVLVLAGVVMLFVLAVLETAWLSDRPWAFSILAPDGVPPADAADAVPVWTREAPRDAYPSWLDWVEKNAPAGSLPPSWHEDRAAIDEQFARPEPIVYGPLPLDTLETGLAQGRMPEPGRPELLAGPLARLDGFELDGVAFRVTGRLAGHVAALLGAYALPADDAFAPLFTQAGDAAEGFILPDARPHADALEERWREEFQEAKDNTAALPPDAAGARAMPAMTGAGMALLGILALALVACGAAWANTRFLRWRYGREEHWLLLPFLAEVAGRPRLWLALHLVCYGTLLGFMALGVAFPGANAALSAWMGQVFTEGGLSFIGEAYASGDVLRAAVATYYHNYVTATLLLTFAVSLVVPFWGVAKTVVSLALVGFVMAPIWAGTFSGYTFHSITMGLEIEAYILAAFAITVYALRVFRGLFRGNVAGEFRRGILVVAGGAVISGVILAAAALYEAVTLIYLHMP
jgi:hypothetical protein